MLVTGRIIQGLGTGGIHVLPDILICDLVPPRHREPHPSIMLSTAALGSTIGLIMGGAAGYRILCHGWVRNWTVKSPRIGEKKAGQALNTLQTQACPRSAPKMARPCKQCLPQGIIISSTHLSMCAYASKSALYTLVSRHGISSQWYARIIGPALIYSPAVSLLFFHSPRASPCSSLAV